MSSITSLSTATARTIENTIILGKNSNNRYAKLAYNASARLISTTVFPIFLLIELAFKQIPSLLISTTFYRDSAQKNKHLCKIGKYCLAILFHPLGLLRADIVSGFFLEQHKELKATYYPKTPEELQKYVKQAIKQNLKICIVGAGTSLGTQITPIKKKEHVSINLKELHGITLRENNTVKVQSGTKWKDLIVFLNARGKSIFVKQPMSDFSIGGSIGINCHGWDTQGSICNTVVVLEIVDDKGEIKTLTPKDEAFKCFFGTLGYFGIIVSVTLKLTENTHLIQRGKIIDTAEFNESYQKELQEKKGLCLCYGKICLGENQDGHKSPKYFREICMVSCQEVCASTEPPVVSENLGSKSTFTEILEEIGMQALSWFPYFISRRIISLRWDLNIRDLLKDKKTTRNEVLHFATNVLNKLKCSNLHTLWLQEYFVRPKNLSNFIIFLGAVLKTNQVSVINATIRILPKDKISILPYAKEDCLSVVICFYQEKTTQAIRHTKRWISLLTQTIIEIEGSYYMAYMPFETQEDFVKCYGSEAVANLHTMKERLDPNNLFSSAFTNKYFDQRDLKAAVPNNNHTAMDSIKPAIGSFVGGFCKAIFRDTNHAHSFFNEIVKGLFSVPTEEEFLFNYFRKIFSD